MFLGTATLSTLHIGISGGSHEIKKVILQHTVGRLQNLFPFCVQHRISVFIKNGFGFPFLTAADLCDRFFYRSPEEFILAPLRPQDLLFHHRDINHMEVVVIHILAQGFGHCPVALIGVHHSGEDILLAAHNLHGGFVGIGIELFGIFIAAVVVEVGRVYIKQQLPIFHRIGFQTTGGDNTICNHLIEHGGIAVGRFLEVDIAVGLGGINILIGVAVFFSLVMLLNFRHIVEGGQVLVTGKGTVNSIVSCHRFFPFFRE